MPVIFRDLHVDYAANQSASCWAEEEQGVLLTWFVCFSFVSDLSSMLFRWQGALRAFEEFSIPIDYIGGEVSCVIVSMYSLVCG